MGCNQNLTEVIAVLDRSGSMELEIANVIEGYNGFVEEQKKGSGECRFTLYIFDSQGYGMSGTPLIEKVYENISADQVPLLTQETYFARGGTPLNDAIGKAIDEAGARYSSIPEEQRPGKVIVFISTDGHENASQEYPRRGNEALRKKIEVQQNEFSWEFVFTAAGVDAYEQNQDYGFDVGNVLRVSNAPSGAAALYKGLSDKLSSYRAGEVQCMNFSAEEKAEVESHADPLGGDASKNLLRSTTCCGESSVPSTPESSS